MLDIVRQIHRLLDAILCYLNLLQNREIGWLTVDRKSGTYKREQQPIWKKIKLLLLFNPVMEWIDRTRLLRYWTHEESASAGELWPHIFDPRVSLGLYSIGDMLKWLNRAPRRRIKVS
jgi:hypothetical protein